MTGAHAMEELKGRSGGDPESGTGSADDDDTLLPEHEFDTGSLSSDDDDDEDDDETVDGEEGRGSGRGRRSIKSNLWVALCTMATLAGRRMLTGSFRECPLFEMRRNTC